MKKEILKTLEWLLAEQKEVMDETEKDITSLKKQIKFLKEEIRKEAIQLQLQQLHEFKKHMSDTFDTLMGDDCTNESCTDFYNMDFEIKWNGKTVTLYNSAETFQTIEYLIETEIDDMN